MAMYNPTTINAITINPNVIDAEARELASTNMVQLYEGAPEVRNIIVHEAKGGLFADNMWSENRWDNRTLPWEGVGQDVSHCLTTEEVARLAKIDFPIIRTGGAIPCTLSNGIVIYPDMPNFSSFLRVGDYDSDTKTLHCYFIGYGSASMTPIENHDMLSLADMLHQMGFRYVNAGMFDQGKVTFMTMLWEDNCIVAETKIDYYVVIVNSFDGSKPFGVYITPICPTCKNTLALAIRKAVRFWKVRHTRNAPFRVESIKQGLEMLNYYRQGLEAHINKAKLTAMDRDAVRGFVNTLFPINEGMTQRVIAHIERQRSEMLLRYDAPDLIDMEPSVWRTECMLTDYYSASHVEPLKHTQGYRANQFKKNLDGNAELNKATEILNSRYDVY